MPENIKSGADHMETKQLKYDFLKDSDREFPTMVVVGITNVCNLACVHCYYKDFIKLPRYKPAFMDPKLYKKIVDEVSLYPGVIFNFGTYGEPLLHEDFLELLRYARKKRLNPINITTNGTMLDKEISKQIVEERLTDVLNISVDAFTKEGYEKVRGTCFEKVISNVHGLIDINAKHNSPLKIMVNMIDQSEVHHELEDFKKYWEPKVDKVIIRYYYSCHGLLDRNKERFAKVDRWPCYQLWSRIFITHEGKALYCCVADWFLKTV
ncbi:MAG: radical SAM protein, partial [Deltaproteobacteria bacterium]